MRNRTVLVFVLGAVVIVGVWWFLVYSPKGDELDEARTDREAAEAQTISLEAELARLQEIEDRGPEIDAALMRIEALIPENPDLASFILAADEIANVSGIDWLSVSPAQPQAGAAGQPSTINLQIGIEGGFFQALDYLNRLEDLQRLVVVDAISIAAASADEEGTSTSGAPNLSISLTGRMFTQAAPDLPAGAEPDASGAATTVPGGTEGTETGVEGTDTTVLGSDVSTTVPEVSP